METQEERSRRVLKDEIVVLPYDPEWPRRFEEEKRRLLACLPNELLGRIEHFGSTAIPHLPAKPIVDMLVEVHSLEETKRRIVPILEAQGYDYFWRTTLEHDGGPFYAWFIRRGPDGKRTHHLHMVEKDFVHWEALHFRDYLIQRPDLAAEYAALKARLAREFAGDRVAYTEGKAEFIVRVTRAAKARFTGA